MSEAGARTRPLGDYSMMGPEFGNIMNRRAPGAWANIPGAKLNRVRTGPRATGYIAVKRRFYWLQDCLPGKP